MQPDSSVPVIDSFDVFGGSSDSNFDDPFSFNDNNTISDPSFDDILVNSDNNSINTDETPINPQINNTDINEGEVDDIINNDSASTVDVIPENLFGEQNDDFDIFGGSTSNDFDNITIDNIPSDNNNNIQDPWGFSSENDISIGMEYSDPFQTSIVSENNSEENVDNNKINNDDIDNTTNSIDENLSSNTDNVKIEDDSWGFPAENNTFDISNSIETDYIDPFGNINPNEQDNNNEINEEVNLGITEEKSVNIATEEKINNEDIVEELPSDLFGTGPSVFDELAADTTEPESEFDFFGSSESYDNNISFGETNDCTINEWDQFDNNLPNFQEPVFTPETNNTENQINAEPIKFVQNTNVVPPPISTFVPPVTQNNNQYSVNGFSVFQPVAPNISEPTTMFNPWENDVQTNDSNVEQEPFSGDSNGIEITREPHAVASFGFNGKLFVFHNSSNYQIKEYSMKQMLAPSNYSKDIEKYKGPFNSNSLQNIKDYIKQKIQRLENNIDISPEYTLLWNLLLIITEHSQKSNNFLQNEETKNLILSLLKNNNEEWLDGSNGNILKKKEEMDRNSLENIVQDIQSKIENGQPNEAFNLAITHKLYDHALIIGNILGSSFYSKAVSLFIKDNLVDDCSLRSIYLLCAEQEDEQNSKQNLRKWKNHVSLLLSNNNNNSNSRESLTKLGDKLCKGNNIVGAHICYLLAGVKSQHFSQSNARIVLLGENHKESKDFVSISSIQLSEILEFAQMQSNTKNTSIHLARYKLIYAGWLLDLGFIDQTKSYLTHIEKFIQTIGADKFEREFLLLFKRFSLRLQKHNEGTSTGWKLFGKVLDTIIGSDEKPKMNSSPQIQKKVQNPINHNPVQPTTNYNPVQTPTNYNPVQNPISQTSFQNNKQPEPQNNSTNQPEPTEDPFGFNEPIKATPNVKPQTTESKPKKAENKNEGSGLVGWFSSFFPKKGKSMDLGGSAMTFSKKHKMWIPPNVDEDEYAASKKKSAAPPPPSASSTPAVNKSPAVSNTNKEEPVQIPKSQASLYAPRPISRRNRPSYGVSNTVKNVSTPNVFTPPTPSSPSGFTMFTPQPTENTNTNFDPFSFDGDISIPDNNIEEEKEETN